MSRAHRATEQFHCVRELFFEPRKPLLAFVLCNKKRHCTYSCGKHERETKNSTCRESANECKQSKDDCNQQERYDLHVDRSLLQEKLKTQDNRNFDQNLIQSRYAAEHLPAQDFRFFVSGPETHLL